MPRYPSIVRALVAILFALSFGTACAMVLGSGELIGPSVDPAGTDPTPPPADPAAPLRVMSYNILVDFAKDGYDPWELRAPAVAGIIRERDPDLIGLQEPTRQQLDDLAALVPGYSPVRLPLYTDTTIWYRTARFRRVDQGRYWLSDRPETDFSRGHGWGNTMLRYVVWARLYDRVTGRYLTFINTHFDNTAPFQATAAPLFVARARDLGMNGPLIVTGDFNSTPETAAYGILTAPVRGFRLTDTFTRAASPQIGERETTHSGEGRIDHVFIDDRYWSVKGWTVDRTRYGAGRHPSDHDAVVVDLAPIVSAAESPMD